jgi:HK97 family phage major capsid protein
LENTAVDNKLVTISQEKLDQICEALGKTMTIQEAFTAQARQIAEIEEKFGRLPIRKGFPMPGMRWEGAESEGDSDAIKKGFLYWIRGLATKGRVFPDTPEFVTKALLEGSSDAVGGVLVPEIFVPELLRIIEERAIMRRMVRVVSMGTDTSNLPSLTTGMKVYWPGETNVITQGDPVFGKVTLAVKTMAALTSASMELNEDSTLGLASLLATLFGEAVADEEDRCILVGNNDPFYGILFASSVNQVTMPTSMDAFTDLTFNDIADLIDAVTSKAQRGARFFFHRTVATIMRKIRDLNHQYIWAPATVGNPATIYGYPYTESDQMPSSSGATTNFIAFGNPSYIFLGDRRQLAVAFSDQVGFKNNEVFWKVTERIAVKVGIPAALARLRTAS